MPITPILLLGSLVFAFIEFLKDVSNAKWNAVITQLVTWAGGVAAVLLGAATDFAGSIVLGDKPLSSLGFWTLFFVGLLASSLFSVVHNVSRTLGTDDRLQLLPGRGSPPTLE